MSSNSSAAPVSSIDWKKNIIDQEDPRFQELLTAIGFHSQTPKVLSLPLFHESCPISPYKGDRRLESALVTPFVREGLAEKLDLMAQALVQDNPSRRLVLIVADAYRPVEVQNELYELFKKNLLIVRPELEADPDQLEIEVQKYVSRPDWENAPHFTGGAADVVVGEIDEAYWDEYQELTARVESLLKPQANPKTGEIAQVRPFSAEIILIEQRRGQILREHTTLLDMGIKLSEIAVDKEGYKLTDSYYYEEREDRVRRGEPGAEPLSPEEIVCRDNRRIFDAAAKKAGIERYPVENWHLGVGTKFQPDKDGKVYYGPIKLSLENWQHEGMMRALFRESVIAFQNTLHSEDPVARKVFAKVALELFGDPDYLNPRNAVCPVVGESLLAKAEPK